MELVEAFIEAVVTAASSSEPAAASVARSYEATASPFSHNWTERLTSVPAPLSCHIKGNLKCIMFCKEYDKLKYSGKQTDWTEKSSQ